MSEVRVKVKKEEKTYPIFIKEGGRLETVQLLTERYQGDKILVVTDSNVLPLYGNNMAARLKEAGYEVVLYTLPAGEKAKSFNFLKSGYDLLVEKGFSRDNLIIALGGGVVGDLAGFLAATYMRGISFVQIPTTLLAQVDSSVGGKTAINHPGGKNLIGAFYQPEMVIIDPVFLRTLPDREFKTGMAEVIKHGFIADRDFTSYLEKQRKKIVKLDMESMIHIITVSCQIKSGVVNKDEKERGLRAILNFGHTIAHALEAVTGYKRYTHGEAVAVGMIGAARISQKAGMLIPESRELIERLINSYNLPSSFEPDQDPDIIFRTLFRDKKVRNNRLRWVLLREIGKPLLKDNLDDDIIKDVLEGLKK